MRKPWVVFTCIWLPLSITAAFAQSSATRVTLPASPECSDAAQSSGSFSPPASSQIEFIEKPKPFLIPGRDSPALAFEFTARVLNSAPLIVDVIDANGPTSNETSRSCGFTTLSTFDAKLKPVLPSVKFGQVLKLTGVMTGTGLKDWNFVIIDIKPSPLPDDSPGACPSKSGIAVSIRGPVPYVNVYNDGTVFYMDYYFNTFRMEKLSPDEMAQLFKAFADSSFNSLPSSPPPSGKVDSHSVTLACSRYQRVPESGLESRLQPVMKQFDLLKARATEHAYYLLMTSGRRKLTILDWPFTQVRLSDIANKRKESISHPPALQDTVPADFLDKLPQQQVITGPVNTDEERPGLYVYVRDEGRLYRVIRNACWGATPHCTTFRDLGAYLVEQVRPGDLTARPPSEKVTTVPARETQLFALSPALEWPSYLGVKIADVPKEGHKLTNQEFEDQPLYSKIFGAGGTGARFVDGDYMYLDVRVCRVDRGAPPSQCVSPIIIKGLYRPVW